MYNRKSFFNRVFINGFINTIIDLDRKNKTIKLLVSTHALENMSENIIETMIFKKSLIESCEKWYKVGAPIIIEGSITVSVVKSSESKNMILRRQIVRVDKIFLIQDGMEYY